MKRKLSFSTGMLVGLLILLSACGGTNTDQTVNEVDEAGAAESTQIELVEHSQWATSAIASSEYASDSWSASQAVGEPNVLVCEDSDLAWATADSNSIDTLTLSYATPVYVTGVNVHESYNPDQVVEIELIETDGTVHSVYSASPVVEDKCPLALQFGIEQTSYLVNSVRITVDQSVLGVGWAEIDAVELVGFVDPASIQEASVTEDVVAEDVAISAEEIIEGSTVLAYRVGYEGGEFTLVDDQTWIDVTSDGQETQYTELERDPWTVYLVPEDQSYIIYLDMYQLQVQIDRNDGSGNVVVSDILDFDILTNEALVSEGKAGVIMATYQGQYTGSFYQVGTANWIDKGDDGAITYFAEINRDSNSIFLLQADESIIIRLDFSVNQLFLDLRAGEGEFYWADIVDAK